MPDDEAENFNDAIEDGRAVIVYPDAGTDAARLRRRRAGRRRLGTRLGFAST